MRSAQRLAAAAISAFVLIGCSFEGPGPAGGLPAAPDGGARTAQRVLPEVVSAHGVAAFDLDSTNDPVTKLPEFVYKGQRGVAPTIRVNPGDTIVVRLHDGLSGTDMSADLNLHFHGLGVSPNKPSDDVLATLAHPGQTLRYVVKIPVTQPPGLYWYHPHVHGQTEYQVGMGGMSGAIVVEGIEKHYPQLASMPENVLVLRSVGAAPGMADRLQRLHGRAPHTSCPPFYRGFVTVNGALQPTLTFEPGKPQFFRVLNATGHRTIDLVVSGVTLQIVGIDGYPLDTHAGPTTQTVSHYVLAPAARVEFVLAPSKATSMRTLCYNSGPVGDQDPAQDLASLKPAATNRAAPRKAFIRPARALAQSPVQRAALPPPAAKRLVVFTEDDNGFYINGKAFDPQGPPTFVGHTGTVERWTVRNDTSEMHVFHLHQVHFLVTKVDGVPVDHPQWSDTFVVPWQKKSGGTMTPGTIELIADFRSAVIKGTFLFHCHILDHEDNGMMAKIQML